MIKRLIETIIFSLVMPSIRGFKEGNEVSKFITRNALAANVKVGKEEFIN